MRPLFLVLVWSRIYGLPCSSSTLQSTGFVFFAQVSIMATTETEKIKNAVLDVMCILNLDPLSLLPFEQTPTLRLEPFSLECIEKARRRNLPLPLPQPRPQAFQEKHVCTGAAEHYARSRFSCPS
ncbi:hypothetical protein DFH07DRAFT_464813 [Mycena maculata]|uniref:Uncharacterized protein n=1 Tax=Mycena maculata TaxID=230809 RepID=A0AAD7K7Y2_9AGAR|nr:hypothetical protein DFH07DRAFT_464813 [Mycena maculata]